MPVGTIKLTAPDGTVFRLTPPADATQADMENAVLKVRDAWAADTSKFEESPSEPSVGGFLKDVALHPIEHLSQAVQSPVGQGVVAMAPPMMAAAALPQAAGVGLTMGAVGAVGGASEAARELISGEGLHPRRIAGAAGAWALPPFSLAGKVTGLLKPIAMGLEGLGYVKAAQAIETGIEQGRLPTQEELLSFGLPEVLAVGLGTTIGAAAAGKEIPAQARAVYDAVVATPGKTVEAAAAAGRRAREAFAPSPAVPPEEIFAGRLGKPRLTERVAEKVAGPSEAAPGARIVSPQESLALETGAEIHTPTTESSPTAQAKAAVVGEAAVPPGEEYLPIKEVENTLEEAIPGRLPTDEKYNISRDESGKYYTNGDRRTLADTEQESMAVWDELQDSAAVAARPVVAAARAAAATEPPTPLPSGLAGKTIKYGTDKTGLVVGVNEATGRAMVLNQATNKTEPVIVGPDGTFVDAPSPRPKAKAPRKAPALKEGESGAVTEPPKAPGGTPFGAVQVKIPSNLTKALADSLPPELPAGTQFENGVLTVGTFDDLTEIASRASTLEMLGPGKAKELAYRELRTLLRDATRAEMSKRTEPPKVVSPADIMAETIAARKPAEIIGANLPESVTNEQIHAAFGGPNDTSKAYVRAVSQLRKLEAEGADSYKAEEAIRIFEKGLSKKIKARLQALGEPTAEAPAGEPVPEPVSAAPVAAEAAAPVKSGPLPSTAQLGIDKQLSSAGVIMSGRFLGEAKTPHYEISVSLLHSGNAPKTYKIKATSVASPKEAYIKAFDLYNSQMRPGVKLHSLGFGVFQDGVKLARELVDTHIGQPLQERAGKYLSPHTASEKGRLGAAVLRERVGQAAADKEKQFWAIKQSRDFIDKNWTQAGKRDFIDWMQRGMPAGDPVLARHPEAMEFGKAIRKLLDEPRDEIAAWSKAKGGHIFEKYIENYFPQIWKNPKDGERFFALARLSDNAGFRQIGKIMRKISSADKRDILNHLAQDIPHPDPAKRAIQVNIKDLYDEWKNLKKGEAFWDTIVNQVGGKGSLSGRQSFLKRRYYDDFKAGLAAGLEPIDDNPIVLALIKRAEMKKFMQGQYLLEDLKKHDLAKFFRISDPVPPGWAPINDKIATRKYMTPSGEFATAGHYYAPSEVSRVIDNYLKPGFDKGDNSPMGLFRRINNAMNQAQLGLSAFHFMDEVLVSAASDVASGIMLGARGQLRGVRDIARGSVPGFSMASHYRFGKKMFEHFYEGTNAPAEVVQAMDLYIRSNPNWSRQSRFIDNSVDKFMREWRQGKYVSSLRKAPAAFLEATAAPLFERIIPRAKAGAFAHAMETEIARNPHMTSVEMMKKVAYVGNEIDNRFGMVNYDNYHWSRGITDIAQAIMRAPGWNVGTIKSIGGGVVEGVQNVSRALSGESAEITPKMAFVGGLTFVSMLYGGVLQYALTGTWPEKGANLYETIRNYIHPKDGRTLPNGEPSRLTLPDYMGKDVSTFARTLLGSKGPGVTKEIIDIGLGKMSPALDFFHRVFYSNQDYRNRQIIDHEAPWFGGLPKSWDEVKHGLLYPQSQLGQYGKAVREQYTPFSFQGALYKQQQLPTKTWGEAITSYALPVLGMVPAARDVSETPLDRVLREKTAATPGIGGEIPAAQIEKLDARINITNRIRQHLPYQAQLAEAQRKGFLTTSGDVKELLKNAHKTPRQVAMSRLGIMDALHVMTFANAKQRTELLPILQRKWLGPNGRDSLPPDVRQEATQTLMKILVGEDKKKAPPAAPPIGPQYGQPPA